MVFKCQEDSYLTEFTSVVKSCTKSAQQIVENGKKIKYDGYDVILDDTILFPEGGGQPCDFGFVNDIKVLQVTRRKDAAVHFTLEPLTGGDTVQQKIDWDRRFDHMQQHSGQHLLSAILEREHKIDTTSWWLGEEESHVELNCTKLPLDLIKKVEERCNDLIRSAIPVSVKVCNKGDPGLDEAHTRGLPEDHVGSIRIISIAGVDENLCCGTHVSNLSHLQAIKLIRAEPGKKNKINLRFLVGKRVMTNFQKCLDREQALTGLLKNDSSKHAELVEKLQKSLKVSNKNLSNVLSDIATLETNLVRAAEPIPPYAYFHKKEGDQDYIKAICRNLEGFNILVFVSVGDGKQGGNILLVGDEAHVGKLGPQIVRMLDGKGVGKGSRYQAKVNDLTDIGKCHQLIKDYFSHSNGV
ncbi:alanyl-tRNA editing protein Aarsd1 [Arctopsyche grandis]|uniref:alanyl-tRNA editing protein Aarsd1 n=1 Tax=Arctopsyche grandis TaxID=121162 RepID=UPI00406D9FAE